MNYKRIARRAAQFVLVPPLVLLLTTMALCLLAVRVLTAMNREEP
jgi:hypothetical protein